MRHLFIFVLLLSFFSLHSCKEKKDNVDPAPLTNGLTMSKFKTWFITDPSNSAGIYVEDSLAKELAVAYGDKDKDGNLLNIQQILIRNKETATAVRVNFDKQEYITSIEVLSGNGKRALNFTNYDIVNKQVNVEMIDLPSKSIVIPKFSLKLSPEIIKKMELYRATKGGRIGSSRCNWFRKMKIGLGMTDCHMQYHDPMISTCNLLGGLLKKYCYAGVALTGIGPALYYIFTCPSKEEALKDYADECENLDEKEQERKYHECARNATLNFELSGNYDELEKELNKCINLTPEPQPGHSTGDPHLTTLDGVSFDFHGHGEFIFCKSSIDKFEVQVRQEDVKNTGYIAMNTAVSINTESDVVCITANPDRLFINNIPQNLNFVSIPLRNGALLRKSKNNTYEVLQVVTQNGDIVAVKYQGGYLLDCSVYLMANRKGKVEGLMGNFDGDKNNDLKVRNGELLSTQNGISFSKMYPIYADSWRIQQDKSLFYYDAGKSTESFTKRDFPKSQAQIASDRKIWAEGVCRAAGITSEPFLSNCITDVALTNDPTLVSSSLWGQTIEIRPPSLSLPVIVDPGSGSGTGIWTKKPDFSGPYPGGVSTAFTIDNIIYTCGPGTDYNDNDKAWLGKASLYAYNPTTNTWVKKAANLPATPNNYQAYYGVTSFVIGRKGYLVTGYENSSGDIARRLWEYDPDRDAWTAKKNLPFDSNAQRYTPVAFSYNGKGYFGFNASIGGASHGRELWEYDPDTDSWKLKTNMPQVAQVGLVTAYGLIGDKLYTLLTQTSPILEPGNTLLYEYDFTKNTWSKKRSLSTFNINNNGIGAVLNGKLYCGLTYTMDANRKTSSNNLFLYDPKNDSWVQVKDFPAVERSSKVGMIANGKLYVGFGSTFISGQGNTYFSDWWEYTP